MAILATYVSGTQFTVSDDRTAYLKHGLRIQALMGVDGTVEGTVDTSSYSAITELTTCTIEESVLTANLATIKRGVTYADSDSSSGNTGAHFHTDWWDGGPMVAAGMTQPQRDILDSLPIPGAGDDNKLIQINDTEDGYELVTLQGTADEITITEAAGTKTISIAETFTLDEADVNFDITTGHAHTGADSTAVDHVNLGSKGTNTHAQIDTFIGSKAQASGIASLDASSKVVQEPASKAQASGIASLNASSKVVEDPANATATPTASKIPLADESGKLAAGWGGAASTLATLDGSAKVVEDPANATATPTASKIPIADGSGKLDGWVSDADASTKGKIQLAGQLSGTAASPEVVGVKESGGQALSMGAVAEGQFLARSGTTIVGTAGTGSGVPATTVTDETDWDVTPAVGTSTNYAREDHTHGTPAEPSGGGGPAPDYTPPSMKWKDADEVTLTPNRYHKAGWRLDGQYQDFANMSSYWDLAAAVDVDVDAPGTMIGGDVVSSWYGLWMTAADTFLVLPYIRVDAITWSDPSTVINPANHSDGTTANNSFVSANDVFNTYRLMLLSDTAYHGTIYTIADSVDGTPDQILITGDKTAEIAATEWLQMIPPSGTACLFLGDIRFHSDGNLRWFRKAGWFYELPDRTTIDGVCNLTPAVTDLGAAIPPTATKFLAGCKIYSAEAATGLTANIYRGADGSDIVEQILAFDNVASSATMLSSIVQLFPLSAVCKIKNSFQRRVSGNWAAASVGQFMITAYET